jgi:hypothetical protein
MTIPLQGVLGLALLGLTGACAGGTPRAATNVGPREAQAVVRVTNHNSMDVNVYGVSFGRPARLGRVTSMSTEIFALPRTMVATGSIQLKAAPIGSAQTHQTETIMIHWGDRVEWTIENSLSQSSYRVNHARPR